MIAAAASRKVWIFRRSGGAGARLHFQLFKGYANAHSKTQIHDFIGISAAGRRPAPSRMGRHARFDSIMP
jgi:hypothetical protein